MAKGYWVCAYRAINDPEKMTAYKELAGPAVQALGGKFLVRGGRIKTAEAGLDQRTIVIEFPSFDEAVAAYDSPLYRKALAVMGDGAERDLRIVEGY